jgi:signal peptidase I
MKKDTGEKEQEESTTFVRPPRQRDWRLICIRIGIIAGATVMVCLFILRPMVISGGSMMPTYSSRGFTFAFLPYFKLYDPQRQQIVVLKHAGFNTFLLKRVLAFPGETVEIHDGVLYVNGKALDEPYVKYPCKWNLTRREVPKGKIFVLGDNRSMPIQNHMGGMIDRDRLAGIPIW